MSLQYNISDLLSISGQNASINAQLPETINGDEYDMAFVGIANFLNGNYVQQTPDVNDITSILTVNEGALNNAHFFYVADVNAASADYPRGGESTYGADITQTGTIFGSAAVNSVRMASGEGLEITSFATFGNEFIAMTNIAAGSSDSVVNASNKRLETGQSSVGDGLLQAISAALFKKLGKNAALLNDTDLVTSLNSEFYTQLNTEMEEDSEDYAASKLFKRYVASGRYEQDAGDVGSTVDYNLNDTVVSMVLEITGSVVDGDDEPNLQSNADAITAIFGNGDLAEHKVADDGTYSIKVFIELHHDERF